MLAAESRRGVVLEATPSKSWQRGNALSYASGDTYAKHGLEAVLSHPLLTKEEEFELGSKVQKLSEIEKTRSELRTNATDASDDSVAKLLGYVDPIDIFRAEVAGRAANSPPRSPDLATVSTKPTVPCPMRSPKRGQRRRQ